MLFSHLVPRNAAKEVSNVMLPTSWLKCGFESLCIKSTQVFFKGYIIMLKQCQARGQRVDFLTCHIRKHGSS